MNRLCPSPGSDLFLWLMKGTQAEQMLASIPLSAVTLVQCRVAPLQQSCLVLTVHLSDVPASLQASCASPALAGYVMSLYPHGCTHCHVWDCHCCVHVH